MNEVCKKVTNSLFAGDAFSFGPCWAVLRLRPAVLDSTLDIFVLSHIETKNHS